MVSFVVVVVFPLAIDSIISKRTMPPPTQTQGEAYQVVAVVVVVVDDDELSCENAAIETALNNRHNMHTLTALA